MKKLQWLVVASAAILLAACGDRETVLSQENTGQAALQEPAELVSGAVAEMPAAPVDQVVPADMAPPETVMGETAETMAPPGDAVDAVREGVINRTPAVTMPEAEAPATAPPAPADAGMTDDVDLVLGKKIYTGSCFACHGVGVAGAPKLDDAENWSPRIAQGMEVMTAHAINGFQGGSGYMPAKGGAGNLTDEEVRAAVAYMVSVVTMASR